MKIKLAFSSFLLIALSEPSMAHDWYSGLRNRYDLPCCNKDDFKPVKAWQDKESGQWIALYPNDDGTVTEWAIPDDLILDDNLNQEPFQAHLAIYKGQVRCFLRKRAGG